MASSAVSIMIQCKIMVVDDEEPVRELLRYNLSREGFEVVSAESGEEALRLIRRQLPDLVLLDLMLPGMDGLEVTRRLKCEATTKDLPIIVLTARTEDSEIVAGLELGADDYITKPFSPRVLAARIRTVLRRRITVGSRVPPVIRIRNLSLFPAQQDVFVNGRRINLTLTEFNTLCQLAKAPGWVLRRSQILEALHGSSHELSERSVDVQVLGLRRKLGESAVSIETVRGIGYRLKAE